MIDVARQLQAQPAAVVQEVDEAEPGRWVSVWRRFRGDYVALASLVVAMLLVVVALAAPLISTYVTGFEPQQQSLLRALRPPGAPNYLGTDELGRDVLTRLVYGARVSLGVAALTVTVALTLGAFLGSLAGYYGGWVDSVIMRSVDALQSIPSLFILIFVSVIFNVGPVSLAFVIASLSWTGISRLVRAEVLSLRTRDFVVAARALGASDARLIVHHVMPNVVPVMIVWATLAVGNVILSEATLSYLGLGIQPPTRAGATCSPTRSSTSTGRRPWSSRRGWRSS